MANGMTSGRTHEPDGEQAEELVIRRLFTIKSVPDRRGTLGEIRKAAAALRISQPLFLFLMK